MTSQPDSDHHAADKIGFTNQESADQTDEQNLHPDARLVAQTKAGFDDGLDLYPGTAESRNADADAETTDDDPRPATVRVATAEIENEADLAEFSFGADWHDIQAMFIDDPRRSVHFAAEKADAAVSALGELLRLRRSAFATAAAGAPNAAGETEELREMLRSYRMFCRSLSDLGEQLRDPAATTR